MRIAKTHKELQDNWRDAFMQWYAAGMPAFNQEKATPFSKLIVKFPTLEDREFFANLLECEFSEEANFIWYPPKDRENNTANRYVEEDFIDE